MKLVKARNLACPLDGTPLACRDRQYTCDNDHAFDIARQGYVNLLPVQHKRSRQPGDTKEMVTARSRFLDAGWYAPLADRLAEMVLAGLPGTGDLCLVDAGCGEGYYLDRVAAYLAAGDRDRALSCIGLDISKFAIAAAAKRNRQITWIVGTNRRPPLAAASVDLVVCVFGFPNFAGFGRILKPGGGVIVVGPGPDHLRELREILYPEVRQADAAGLGDAQVAGFAVVERCPLRFHTGVLRHAQIMDLLSMTPHFHKAGREGREAVACLETLDLTVDVVLNVLVKS